MARKKKPLVIAAPAALPVADVIAEEIVTSVAQPEIVTPPVVDAIAEEIIDYATEAPAPPTEEDEAQTAEETPDTKAFRLTVRQRDYLRALLGQYFGAKQAAESIDEWVSAVELGGQVLVRNKPLRLEISTVKFERAQASNDVTGGDVLLNVHRQMSNVRLLDA